MRQGTTIALAILRLAILSAAFLQLFEANTDVMPEMDRTIRHRCHVLLDEFTSVPVMRAIAKATGFARGFWMHFSFVVQSKNQVREEYKGQGEASLLENVGAEIIFGTDDPTLCKEASERAGFDTVKTLKTWTVVGTAIGVVAFALSWLVYALAA